MNNDITTIILNVIADVISSIIVCYLMHSFLWNKISKNLKEKHENEIRIMKENNKKLLEHIKNLEKK